MPQSNCFRRHATTALFAVVTLLLIASRSRAELNVVATTTDLRAIAAEVGGAAVSVDSISKGTQDPHFIEAKPSFMVKANRADLLISVGLDLEIGWLPSITRGARNPKIAPGEKGYLEVGSLVEPLEVPKGSVTRAEGDVHPLGNPHVWLDPLRAGQIGAHIARRLAELDPPHATLFAKNAQALQARLKAKTEAWQARLARTKVTKIVTHHRTLSYFFDRFRLQNPAVLEPKPGIPPTAGHIIQVIGVIRDQAIPLILVENFFDAEVTRKIKSDLPFVRTASVPVSVGGAEGVTTLDDLYEALVRAVEGKIE